MRVRVKLFALLREKTGTDTMSVEVPEGATITQVVATVQRLFPLLAPYLGNIRFALQMDFVDADTIVAEGDEIALIPPVSGGN